MTVPHDDFAARLRAYMRAQDLSQSALARMIGVDASYVNLLANGRRPLTDGLRAAFWSSPLALRAGLRALVGPRPR